MTLPTHRGPNGMPVGIQLVALPREDRRLFAAPAGSGSSSARRSWSGHGSETNGDVEMGHIGTLASPPPLAGEG